MRVRSAGENHGIYWIDRQGNRELLYRDPAISCLSPISLRARPRPPVLPAATASVELVIAASGADRPATIGLMNVYDSDFAWPEGTEITRLRVLQILPKSVPARNTPRIGVAEQTNARAVLGTVPVERDGNAFFKAPPGKLSYTRSYNNLAQDYGFYFHAHSSWFFGSSPACTASRTIAGQFGARAAKLLDYPGKGHYGVQLSAEDFHRVPLWLDCNSEFYGAYENPEAQAQGEVIYPSLA